MACLARFRELLDRYDPPPFIRRQWVEAPGPGTVRAYLEESARLWLHNERRAAPPGLPVFVTGEVQRDLLARLGLETAGAEGPVWRVAD